MLAAVRSTKHDGMHKHQPKGSKCTSGEVGGSDGHGGGHRRCLVRRCVLQHSVQLRPVRPLRCSRCCLQLRHLGTQMKAHLDELPDEGFKSEC